MPGLPEDLPRGRKVELRILGCDLVDLVMDAQLVRILDDALTPEEEGALEEALDDAQDEALSEQAPEDAAETAASEASEKPAEAPQS